MLIVIGSCLFGVETEYKNDRNEPSSPSYYIQSYDIQTERRVSAPDLTSLKTRTHARLAENFGNTSGLRSSATEWRLEQNV